ncbi:MAG: helix-turn-helix transcriptional regulator [Clostridiales bacterium]|jgi:transcriptional regulator with XRE-family HTH domain|nr:helix-turn-helix transcriptional regulator [Clostridiales bacterium]
MTITDEIRVLCARLNISMAELARRLGSSPQSLSAKMSRKSFTVEELEKIAEVTNTSFVRKFVLLNGEEI